MSTHAKTISDSIQTHGMRSSRGETSLPSIQSVLIYGMIAAGGLAATVALGPMRLVDLAIACAVVVLLLVLAVSDAFHLPTVIVGVWMFQPLVRRVVDWYSGGYTSITVLSLLPMIATASLLVPVWTHYRKTSAAMLNAVWLLTIPIIIAGTIGTARNGVAAVPECGGFLMPILFFPYFALRSLTESERRRLLRVAIIMAALSAAYGWWQYLTMPAWDRMWLIESGMTSSMGRAEAGQMRVWGTLNSAGVAAVLWAMALVATMVDRTWNGSIRWCCAAILAVGTLLTLGRTAWLMVIGGLLGYAVFAPERNRHTALMGLMLGAMVIAAGLFYLPGSERVLTRLSTFGELSEDDSFNSRISITQTMFKAVLNEPFGIGLGSKAADKVKGSSVSIMAADNGYADLILSFGLPGAVMLVTGLCITLVFIRRRKRNAKTDWFALCIASCMSIAIGTLSALLIGGSSGMWMWMICGLAAAGIPAKTQPTTTSNPFAVQPITSPT